jgi:hypothetical protein
MVLFAPIDTLLWSDIANDLSELHYYYYYYYYYYEYKATPRTNKGFPSTKEVPASEQGNYQS